MKRKYKHYPACFVSFLTLFFVMAFLIKFTIFKDIEDVQNTMANKLLLSFHDMYREGQGVLANLIQINDSRCSAELLLAMRKNLFASNYIKDIAYIKDGTIQCTTGLGLTNIKDTLNAEPTFISDEGTKVWVRHPFQLRVLDDKVDEWTIARYKNFSLIIKPQAARISSDFIYPWEQTRAFADTNKIEHVGGSKGLWAEHKAANFLEKIVDHHSETCSTERTGYCFYIKSPLKQTLAIYKEQFVLLLVFSLFCAAISYMAILRLETKFYSIPKRIARGLKNKQFYWMYQPIVDLRTNKIIGCETLARFHDKEGDISPYHFIPIIRNMNMSWKFTEMMVEKIMDDFDKATQLPDGLRISINIFPYDIQQGHTHALTSNKRLTESRFKIALEVTEDEYLEYEAAQSSLTDLTDAGFSISIDDLGTGYSNLKLLNELNASCVKIDRSFVKGIENDGLKSSIIPHIVEIANKFGMEFIAEGIELKEQADIIRKMGVSYSQGWYFGKPMTLTELTNLINKAQ